MPREKYEENEITCIGCPKSCLIRAEIDHHPSTTFADGLDGDALQLSGHLCAVDTEGANFSELHLSGYLCAVGYEYAHKELTAPHRNLTSLVHVVGGERTVVSVKTTTPVPKESIFTCIEEIAKTTAAAPINRGDVLIKNIAGTGADVVATADITAVIPTTLQEKICPI
ncbi:MAG: DUF1667 domain-containing protein [Lachnospiraceae bacterium]|nr:DUF1667 domain-containing protein [Lachnospiraceae bacterium]